MMEHAGYPKRTSHFAHKAIRLMMKTCAAQELGAEACWLVTVIAHTEDAKRYSGPVMFYNEQLFPLCGIANVKALQRARERAVALGWLHYEAGARATPARYWVTVPEVTNGIKDTPVDEKEGELRTDTKPISTTQMSKECPQSVHNVSLMCPQSVHNVSNSSTLSLALSPDPGPKENCDKESCRSEAGEIQQRVLFDDTKEKPSKAKKIYDLDGFWEFLEFPDGMDTPEVRVAIVDWVDRRKSNRGDVSGKLKMMLEDAETPDSFVKWLASGTRQEPIRYSDDFVAFWGTYPKSGRAKKSRAWVSWKTALVTTPPDKILRSVQEFATSDMGKSGQWCPHPHNWLDDRRWEDPTESWKRTETNGGNGNGRAYHGQPVGSRHVYNGPLE